MLDVPFVLWSGQPKSKADMVRAAVAAGMESPSDGVGWIKATYGVDLAKPMWSSYRAQQKAREGKGGDTPRQPRLPVQLGGIPSSFGDDVKIIKQLIEQAGSGDQFKELSNTLASLNQKYGQAGLDSLIAAME